LWVAVATMIGAVGLAAGGTEGALLGARLAGSDAAAGLPLGLLVLGSAAAAVMMARLTARFGRIRSLVIGYLIGVVGAGLVLAAVALSNLVLFLVGSVLAGAANAAIFLARYAAASMGGPGASGRALGSVFLGTAFGAVASSAMLGPSDRLSHAFGLPDESGLYLVAVAAFVIAACILLVISTVLGRSATLVDANRRSDIGWTQLRTALLAARTRTALLVLALSNFVMVGAMAVAPVHLTIGGMTLRLVGIVISIHVAGMFGPAPLSGWLSDRRTPRAAATTGSLMLLSAGLAGAALPGSGRVWVTIVLALLGVGWNFGVVGGSTMLAASVPSGLRVHTESIGEVGMGIAAATAAPLAGLVTHSGGLTAMWLLDAAVALVIVATLMRATTRRQERSI